jgi:muramoyltetrapeptide carboxypeptidase
LKAKALKKGDTIGIVSPASPAPYEDIKKAIENLTVMGYNIIEGKSIYDKLGYLAGDDTSRATDINDFFEDKRVDAIFCVRGGYGSPRILDKIDYRNIKKNSKIFMGFSDITALNIAIYQKTGLRTFHGPMVTSNFINGLDELSRISMEKALKCKKSIGLIEYPEADTIKRIVGGRASGKLVGGNLALITALMGTPYEIDTKGKLLFLEEIEEEP